MYTLVVTMNWNRFRKMFRIRFCIFYNRSELTHCIHIRYTIIKTCVTSNTCKHRPSTPLNSRIPSIFIVSWTLLFTNRGHPCLGLAAIFAGMLYNVQIIQKSRTRNIMHISIIVLELPPNYSGSLIKWIEWGILREWPLLFDHASVKWILSIQLCYSIDGICIVGYNSRRIITRRNLACILIRNANMVIHWTDWTDTMVTNTRNKNGNTITAAAAIPETVHWLCNCQQLNVYLYLGLYLIEKHPRGY